MKFEFEVEEHVFPFLFPKQLKYYAQLRNYITNIQHENLMLTFAQKLYIPFANVRL